MSKKKLCKDRQLEMHIIRSKKFTRKKKLVPEISPRKLKFPLAIREYASLNSSPDIGEKLKKSSCLKIEGPGL